MGKRKLITALAAACLYATTFIAGNAIAATTADHNKEIIGYVPNWQAWKGTADGVFAKGLLNQANIDYTQYTILNFSFFGVAVDGSMHSGDSRNKSIYKAGVVQEPAPLLFEDTSSSWDKVILFGEHENVWSITPAAAAAGYTTTDWRTWTNTITGETGEFPISLPKEGGAKGMFDLAHENGKKVMASIGGWSMCKHFPEMAADATKRARFMADVKRLIDMGFDGIDLDWEYPGSGGMNIENYSQADYDNFLTLVKEIRQVIGPNKLITAAFYQAESKLAGFNWPELDKYMDFYNMMTYDSNGGWSNIAGHNSPTSAYGGQEWNMNYDATMAYLKKAGVNLSKVNMGVPFYGRGVVTDGPAALNAPTVKSAATVQPDGPITTASDFASWGVYDGTPPYYVIKQKMGEWTRHWDAEAKVPYLTKGDRFLSYDDEESIGIKAQFIKDNGFGGAIVWDAFGDVECTSLAPSSTAKVPVCADLKTPLLDKMNEVFAGGVTLPKPPVVSASAPASVVEGQPVTITATASDADGTVTSVSFSDAAGVIETDVAAPYEVTLPNLAVGSYSITVTATDNDNKTASTVVNFEVTPDVVVDNPPAVSGLAPAGDVLQKTLAPITVSVTATDDKGVAGVTINGVAATKAGDVYSASITPTAFGLLDIVAVATDSAGQTAELTGTINVVEDTTVVTVDPWVSGTVYVGKDQVSHNGKCYEAKWWTNTDEPGASQWGPWKEIACP